MSKTILLAHYYTDKAIRDRADFIGDSLELARKAQESQADRIVFAGVRFMAETAKILNPDAEVILPDWNSTCSLVEQTDIRALRKWREEHPNHTHVMYINSSVEQKALADWIVTSRNVEPVVRHLLQEGKEVIFSPDYNMGVWLKQKLNAEIPIWNAVCEVHDQFDQNRMEERFASFHPDKRFLISHPESPIGILKMSDLVASTSGMLEWIDTFDGPEDSAIFVGTEFELIKMMRERRPDLNGIYQVPAVPGCRCNECPYMKLNTMQKVEAAMAGEGVKIDYLTPELMERARLPIERMMSFQA